MLAITIAVYGYLQPHKDMVANLLEVFVQINFLVLVFLWATPHITEELFVFESSSTSDSHEDCVGHPEGIAEVTWILMPVFYLPMLALLLVLAAIAGEALRY